MQPADDAGSEHLTPEKPVSILLIEILQALKRWITGFRRELLDIACLLLADDGRFYVDDRAAKIAGHIETIAGS